MALKKRSKRKAPKRISHQNHLAERARSLEIEAVSLVAHFKDPSPPVERTRKGSTRGHEVEANGARIRRLWEAHRMSESNGPAVRAAYALWKEMKARVWELAMTSKRVADLEARRLSKQWADEEDLRQDGYIGLERAALRFDPSQGVKFDTYARWWTRAEMTRALEQRGRTIRIPAGAAEQVRLINRVRSEWEGMGREFTLADVAERLSIDESRVRRLLSVGSAVSLETEVDTGSSRRALRSVIEEEIAPNPESFTTLRDQLSRLERVMAERLEVRERQVLIQRYGLEDGTFRTFKDIGKGMGISRERVRQIELTAFEKIRKNQLFRERTSRREWNRAA